MHEDGRLKLPPSLAELAGQRKAITRVRLPVLIEASLCPVDYFRLYYVRLGGLHEAMILGKMLLSAKFGAVS